MRRTGLLLALTLTALLPFIYLRHKDRLHTGSAAKAHMLPTVFVPHGGGPMPILGDHAHAHLTSFLKTIARQLPKPKSLLLVSAHWEEPKPTVNTAAHPDLLYDYYGFPQESYSLKYPAPGQPELARKVVQLLRQSGFEPSTTDSRGWDHGVFVPLSLMYPTADIPIVQISLLQQLNPTDHIRLGQALRPLRSEGVLIVGSGMSFHNMGTFMGHMRGNAGLQGKTQVEGQDFDDYLVAACTQQTGAAREALLEKWAAAPGAKQAHPREEHLLPLMVVAGAAGDDPGAAVYRQPLLGGAISGFVFGSEHGES